MQAWGEWDLPSITTQLAYYQRHPPVHQLVAAYLQYTPPAAARPAGQAEAQTSAAAEALIGAAPELPEHLRPRIPNPYAKRPAHG